MVGCKGSVSLDARFDAGYFCTVKVGRLEFKGINRIVKCLFCIPTACVIHLCCVKDRVSWHLQRSWFKFSMSTCLLAFHMHCRATAHSHDCRHLSHD